MPFPQTDFVQTLGAPTHDHPGSIPQVAEQPSPFAVLPSSHCLPSSTLPSPQMGMHAFPGTGHSQPGSMLWQSAEHPSPLTVFPSSQTLLDVEHTVPARALVYARLTRNLAVPIRLDLAECVAPIVDCIGARLLGRQDSIVALLARIENAVAARGGVADDAALAASTRARTDNP